MGLSAGTLCHDGLSGNYTHPSFWACLGNLPTLQELQERSRLTLHQAADFVGVLPETYRRCLSGRNPNVTAVRRLTIRACYLPWPGWRDWEMRAGKLYPPGYRQGVRPGEILAVPYRLQLIAELKRQVP
jgi:hypothetical protein